MGDGTSEFSPVDALVVLGKGFNHVKAERPTTPLSLRSRLNVDAAANLFHKGSADKLVLSGGHTAKNMPTEAEAMKAYLKEKYPDIPDDAVVLENESIDTAANAEKSKVVLEQLGAKKVALVTNQDHLRRSERFFRNYGVPLDRTYASEKVVPDVSEYYPPSSVRHMRSVRRKEAVLTAIQRVDPKGKLIRPFTRLARGR